MSNNNLGFVLDLALRFAGGYFLLGLLFPIKIGGPVFGVYKRLLEKRLLKIASRK